MFAHKLLFAVAAVAATTVATAPAFAAEFTGPRAEIHAGYDNVSVPGENPDGIMYGLGVGYDFSIGGGMIAGVEANFDLSTADETLVIGTARASAEAKRDIELSARIGTKVSDDLMVYAKAGYTNARFGGSTTTGATTVSDTSNLDGVRLGVGAEYALGEKAYTKLEYRYSNYENGVERNQLLAGVGIRF